MKMSDVTACGRPVDPTYPTNLAIVLLSMIVTIAATVWRLVTISSGSLVESALWGVGAGIAVFLTWALSRELDPDHDLAAFVGVGLAIIALLFLEVPALLVFVWILLALRIVNRSVGLRARPLDTLAVLGLGAWLTWQGDWIVGLMTTIAFLLDGLLRPPFRTHLFVSGLAFAGLVILAVFRGGMAMEGGATLPVAIASVVMAALFLVVIATSREIRSVGDMTGEPLVPRRVRAAQFLALAIALLFAAWHGASGLEAHFPLWAAMVGVGLYRIAILSMRSSRSTQT
jgi:hypothetical protein